MMHFTSRALLITCALTVATGASANMRGLERFDFYKTRYQTRQASAFKSERDSRIDRVNHLLTGDKTLKKVPVNDYLPAFSLGPSNMTGDMDAPNGERWYYTASYEYTVIPADYDAGIYFTDYIVKHYHFDIYDADCKLIGSIDAPMEYAEDEKRLANIEIAPVASRHFFNTDDNVEIMVGLGINTMTPGMNRYRTLVYSLKEDKSEVADKPVYIIESLLSDSVEGPMLENGHDNFYMIFADDYLPEDVIEDENASYWDFVTAARMQLNFYAPARDNENGPVMVDSKPMPLLQLPGDQESSPYLMSYVHDGEVRYVFSYLEEPIWERYDDPIYGDLIQREGNKLNVEFYTMSATEGLKLDHVAKIDVGRDLEDEMAIASFFGVGDMNYYGDLLYDAPDAPEGKPYLVVTRTNYNPASDNSSTSYFVYDHEGKMHHELAVYCDSSFGLSDIEGYEPQQVFVTLEGGQYLFRFVDLYSGKEKFATSNYVEIGAVTGPEQVMANLDRTPVGDSYEYVFELLQPDVDDAGATALRVLWLKANGAFDRIDKVNVGEDVMYAKMYIDSEALRPGAIHSDDSYEYMALVKRGIPGDVMSEELMIAQPVSEADPEGKTLLHLVPDERGRLASIIPYLGGENPTLTVYYYNDDTTDATTYTQDVYSLPLDGSVGVVKIEGENPVFSMDGATLNAAGVIKVYSISGAKVAETEDSLDLSGLSSGIYVVTAGGSSAKICVK